MFSKENNYVVSAISPSISIYDQMTLSALHKLSNPEAFPKPEPESL
jgi:hypothetical protein